MYFADIHNHMLFGVDDGAHSEEETYQIIDASYSDGVRRLCFTPHYHPGYFGERGEQVRAAFELARSYSASRYPDLAVYLGNELRYERSFAEWLKDGKCWTVNNTEYVLADFLYPEPADNILDAMLRIMNSGYTPILAHVERYEKLHRDLREIDRLKSWGVVIQLDAQSVLGNLGYFSKARSRRILSAGLADFVASDAHDLTRRPPQLSRCCNFISKHYGEEYARILFWDNPIRILEGKAV